MTMTTPNNAAHILALADGWTKSLPAGAVQPPAQDIALTRDPEPKQSPEARLEKQIADLDLLWIGLARRAAASTDAHATDMLLRLALKCQQQATRAVATLAEIKSRQRLAVVDVVDT